MFVSPRATIGELWQTVDVPVLVIGVDRGKEIFRLLIESNLLWCFFRGCLDTPPRIQSLKERLVRLSFIELAIG
jgi:hypothetical protein